MFYRYAKVTIVAVLVNLLMGCAGQLVQQGKAEAQQQQTTETTLQDAATAESIPFLSAEEEFLYKILVAEFAGQREQYILAVHYLLDVAESSQDAELAERATRIALYARRYDLVIQAARLWVEIAPDNPDARQILGGVLLKQGDSEEAIQQLEIMLNQLKDNPEPHINAVIALLEQQEDQTNAVKIIEKLVKKYPNDPTVLFAHARLLTTTKEYTQAVATTQKLLKLVPNHEQGVPLYAYLLEQQEKPQEALQWFQQILLKYPNDEWRLIYARMLVAEKQYPEAIQQFQLLLETYPENVDILYYLGVLFLQVEDFAKAKDYLQQLEEIDEQPDTARYLLGQLAETEKDFPQAKTWYEKVGQGSNYLDAQTRIVAILVQQNQVNEAIDYLHEIKTAHTEDEILLIQYEAELLTQQTRYPEAIAIYNKAIEKYPSNTDLLYARAMVAEAMGNLIQMEQDFRQILKIDPKNVNTLNALGYTLADRTTRYEEAYQLIKQAYALDKDSFYVLDSMGWVLYRLGQYEEAINYLEKALATKDDPEVAAHFGEALWTDGNKEKAKQIWQKAKETFPENKLLQKVMQRYLP